MPRRWCDELGGRKARLKLGSNRRRADVVIDMCCGTATSASKFYLLKNKNAIVIGIDRYKSKSWVEGHLKDLPREARDRFFFFREDVSALSMPRLSRSADQTCMSIGACVTVCHHPCALEPTMRDPESGHAW